ncbi:MAG: hypothetical protein ABR532_02345 [Candidatus Dormibacteria bacterium]
MKRAPPPPCLHLTVVSSDGKHYRCSSCGQEMVVASTTRSGWAEMGRRLQRIRRRQGKAGSGQGALEL